MMEVGSVGGVALTNTEILYTLSYEAPVVIAGVPSHNGDEEAVVRMRQMPSGGAFSLYLDIPNHGQGEGAICGGNAHASEAFSWLITDSGSDVSGVQVGATTGGICAGGSLCNADNGCAAGCDHSTGFDWVDIEFNPAINACELSNVGLPTFCAHLAVLLTTDASSSGRSSSR